MSVFFGNPTEWNEFWCKVDRRCGCERDGQIVGGEQSQSNDADAARREVAIGAHHHGGGSGFKEMAWVSAVDMQCAREKNAAFVVPFRASLQ